MSLVNDMRVVGREVRKIENLERFMLEKTFNLHRVPLKKAAVYAVGKLSFEKFFPTSRSFQLVNTINE